MEITPQTLTKEVMDMKTFELSIYLEHRANIEGVKIDRDYILSSSEIYFNKGVRSFFGVQLDEDGNILSDTQQPFKGFIDTYRKVIKWAGEINEMLEVSE